MGSPTNAIITDELQSMSEAIGQLREENIFTGHHILDINDVLKKLKYLTNISFDLCMELAEASTESEYSRKYSELLEIVKCDPM